MVTGNNFSLHDFYPDFGSTLFTVEDTWLFEITYLRNHGDISGASRYRSREHKEPQRALEKINKKFRKTQKNTKKPREPLGDTQKLGMGFLKWVVGFSQEGEV